MAEDDKNLENEVEILKKDIVGLKTDIRELQRIMMTVDVAESKADDERELNEIDQQLNLL